MRHPFTSGTPAAVLLSLILHSCSGAPTTAEPEPGVGETQNPVEAPSEPETPTPKVVVMPDETPNVFRVKFTTTVGEFVVEAHRDWAPLGTDRFFELVKGGFYKDIAFFRVIPRFMAQFGIHGDPEESGEWRGQRIEDDPVKQSNSRGTISFATAGPNTRTTQMFINFVDNKNLDAMGFAPFAKVVEGMEVVDKIHQIGERPAQQLIQGQGNAYLKENFPAIDYILSAAYVR